MRPLYHPRPEEITVEGILYALADPVRVRIFTQLAKAEQPKTCCHFSDIKETPLPKSTLSQHFKILRESGLIYSERKGVEMLSKTRCAELRARFGPMIENIIKAYAQQGGKKASKK